MPERKISYERLEHKADTGFLVRAPSLERLYIDCALSLTDHLAKLDTIQEIDRQKIQVAAENREGLLVKWLNEILFLFETQKFLSRRIVFEKFDGKSIQAMLIGDIYNPLKHGHPSEIKAVTYHQLQVGEGEKPEPHFFAKVFLDL